MNTQFKVKGLTDVLHTAGLTSDQLSPEHQICVALVMYKFICMPDAVLRPRLEVEVIQSLSSLWRNVGSSLKFVFDHFALLVQSSFFQKETVCLPLLFYSCAAACSLCRAENFSWKQTSRSPSIFVFNWMLTEV